MVQREPLGVIGGIGAWNFPMQTCVWKVRGHIYVIVGSVSVFLFSKVGVKQRCSRDILIDCIDSCVLSEVQ